MCFELCQSASPKHPKHPRHLCQSVLYRLRHELKECCVYPRSREWHGYFRESLGKCAGVLRDLAPRPEIGLQTVMGAEGSWIWSVWPMAAACSVYGMEWEVQVRGYPCLQYPYPYQLAQGRDDVWDQWSI